MSGRRRAAMGMAAALLAGCSTGPASPSGPAPVAAAPPPVVVDELPPAPAEATQWLDLPLSSGDWSYASQAGGSEARFGQAAGLRFSLRCDSVRRRILLGPAGGTVRVRTTYGVRTLGPGASLDPGDPLLDEIAFSRGRFAVESEGAQPLIVPAWPEPARVIEDCRG